MVLDLSDRSSRVIQWVLQCNTSLHILLGVHSSTASLPRFCFSCEGVCVFALTPNVAASCATNPDNIRCHLSSSRRENSSADAATTWFRSQGRKEAAVWRVPRTCYRNAHVGNILEDSSKSVFSWRTTVVATRTVA